ncbi:MAG: Na+/H+ antiporter NhaC family protein [Planctomycetota bacterium]|nr:Na+/H+ antiporter NhaC family protein [Planctomycetota bacterium]
MDTPEYISPVDWWCILPPLLTIVLAILTKRIVLSLVLGIASGVILLLPSPAVFQEELGTRFTQQIFLQENARSFIGEIFEVHLWGSLVDKDHIRVFLFTTILGMQVALIHRMGGMLGIVQLAAPLARSRRGGQLMTWFMGLIVFIDDYANTLLLGSTMRPITDRLKISREKLAFLVDSTAAPVSGLALISTWVATEIGNMEEGYAEAGVDISGQSFGIFLQTIPSRFYVLFALGFVFLCGLLCRDFGPMLRAERKALGRKDDAATDKSATSEEQGNSLNAILPIFVTVAVVLFLLAFTGKASSGLSDWPAWDEYKAWGEVIGQGDSYLSLVYGALAGLLVTLGLNTLQRRLTNSEARGAMLGGFTHVLPALVILWLAWALSNLTGENHLAIGDFLADKLKNSDFNPAFFPTVIFVFSASIAFSTGTSWGTMAIVLPMSIPLVHKTLTASGAAIEPDHFLMTASIASVLAGAIFGDHCSPISDTTILSSRSSDCDHIAHVRTQMPYALTIGTVAILCGTLPAGYGVSAYVLLPLGLVAMFFILLFFGRRATPLESDSLSTISPSQQTKRQHADAHERLKRKLDS